MTRNALAEASRRNAEVLAAMGMAGRINARWNAANQNYLTQPPEGQRCRWWLWLGLQSVAHDAAIGGARHWRLSRDQSGGNGRHHHRRGNPRGQGSGTG